MVRRGLPRGPGAASGSPNSRAHDAVASARQPSPARPAPGGHSAGQSLAEFALVLVPLFMILLGIIQLGFVLNAYVTIANASREGARSGSIYLYDRTLTAAENDEARAEAVREAILDGMGLLSRSSPQFANSSTWTVSGNTYTSGDLVISYSVPDGVTANDAREGEAMSVSLDYHLDLIIPLVSSVLPHDAQGRLPLTAQVTMVVN
jgi:Flp pilus assembly protein TadG